MLLYRIFLSAIYIYFHACVKNAREIFLKQNNNVLFAIILSSDPCDGFECGNGSECQIYEPTGEAFCNPNCEELNPCKPHQVCRLQPVHCVRAPCPPVLHCEDSKSQD